MGRLFQYIVWEIIKLFFPIWVGLSFFIFLIEWITRFFQLDASFGTIALLYFYKLPYFLELVYPPSILFAVLLVLGGMNRNREIVAAQSMGYRSRDLVFATLSAVLLVSVPYVFLSQDVGPKAMKEHYEIYDVRIKKRASRFSRIKKEKVWFRSGENTLYQVGFFDPQNEALLDVEIFEFNPSFELKKIIQAKRALWNGAHWVLLEGKELFFSEEQQWVQKLSFSSQVSDLKESPGRLKRSDYNPETMTQGELKSLIKRYKDLGINASQWIVIYHSRWSLLLVAFVFVLLAFPRTVRFHRQGTPAKDATYVALLCFTYWFFYNYCLNLGSEAKVNPVLAAWAPSFVLGLYAAYSNRSRV